MKTSAWLPKMVFCLPPTPIPLCISILRFFFRFDAEEKTLKPPIFHIIVDGTINWTPRGGGVAQHSSDIESTFTNQPWWGSLMICSRQKMDIGWVPVNWTGMHRQPAGKRVVVNGWQQRGMRCCIRITRHGLHDVWPGSGQGKRQPWPLHGGAGVVWTSPRPGRAA